jgi:hypothetical protein
VSVFYGQTVLGFGKCNTYLEPAQVGKGFELVLKALFVIQRVLVSFAPVSVKEKCQS